MLEMVNPYYKNTEFKYIVTGHKSLPEWKKLMPIAEDLRDNFLVFCYNATIKNGAANEDRAQDKLSGFGTTTCGAVSLTAALNSYTILLKV